jgi:hypothetical protein
MDHRGRRSLRLPDYDYSQAGIYFITICTHKKRILLAHIIEDRIRLTTAGHIVQSIWESLHKRFPTIQTDSFVVMPNHIHGIIIIIEDNVGAIHRSCRDTGGTPAVSPRRAVARGPNGVRAGMNCPYTNLEINDERCYYRK